jgi:hypothetical protein
MAPLGIHLTLLVGPTVALPAPPGITEALESVEVTHDDSGRSGFQISLQATRNRLLGLADYPLVRHPLLRPFNRVILIVTVNALPRVLMDGIITRQDMVPGEQTGAAALTLTGEDVSLMMDLEERTAEHPAQPEVAIATKLILSYARYGLVPRVVPPLVQEPPLPIERTPVQRGTDLAYLNEMAQRYGHVFFVEPGPLPFANSAYWGPPPRLGFPQRALSVNMGPLSNVDSISFASSHLAPARVAGATVDRRTNAKMPLHTFASTRPPLVSRPAGVANFPNVRTRLPEAGSARSYVQSLAQAQAVTDTAAGETVTATGEFDATRYGDVLRARGLVGLRGAGQSHDGLYYVKRVTHKIARGSYRQSFTLTREGQGALLPVVRP